MTSALRALADELHELVMDADPFEASVMGMGRDDAVPDVSEAAEVAYRAALQDVARRAAPLEPAGPDRTLFSCVLDTVQREGALVDAALVEHTVSTMSHGPALLFLMAASTHLATPVLAAQHLTRVRGYAGYLDACLDRLRAGQAKGRLPVASLVEVTRNQIDGYLASDEDPISAVAPPVGWDGAPAWSAELAAVVRDEVRPAVQCYRDAIVGLAVRSDDRCGLVHLPRGAEDYDRLIYVHTTLPVTAEQVHALGVEAVDGLVAQMTELGATVGLASFDEVLTAARLAASSSSPLVSLEASREAVRRAEAAASSVLHPPLPGACVVEPMSEQVAAGGAPAHYEPPSDDGRPGTFFFNTVDPGAGGGWDLEATAFHEAVPGHHLQLARMGLLTGVPRLQTHLFVNAHGEGWAMYAELLAEEMGLYSSTEQRLGALSARLFRAARLVVDTGVHARGWTREEALAYFRSVVPMADSMLVSEVNRYIGVPGQALGYYLGFREILRLREHARTLLGSRFDLAGFHGALLDHGCLPMTTVAAVVDDWVTSFG